MSRRNGQRHLPELLTTLLGMSLDQIEWFAPATLQVVPPKPTKVSNRERKRLRVRAYEQGKRIVADWLTAAKEHSARIAKLVSEDKIWLAEEAQREWLAKDAADSSALAHRLTDRLIPSLTAAKAKERRAMGKAIKRERQRLNEAASKLAKAKLAAFKARR
jgi:hypothetical protein